MSWSVLILGELTVSARSVGGVVQSKGWLEDLEDPVVLGIHAAFTAHTVSLINRVVLNLRCSTSMAARISGLIFVELLLNDLKE